MADTLIKDLTTKATVAATDQLPINDAAGGDVDKKILLSGVKTFTSASPTLVTPALGTPASGVLTSCTGLPLTTGVTGILPSANMDADTAHLSGAQTFSGAKTFSASPILSAVAFDFDGNNLDDGGVVFLIEQAAADGDVAGSGQHWVKTATPNVPMFTDDAGTDFEMASKVGTNAATESYSIALGDESTVLAAASTSVPVVTFNMPYAFHVTDVKASVTVAGTGVALVTVDVHEAGTTILSTKVTIDASEKTSGTAATAPVVSAPAIAEDALMEVFVDLVDTNNLAAGLKVYLIGYQT